MSKVDGYRFEMIDSNRAENEGQMCWKSFDIQGLEARETIVSSFLANI